MARKGSRGPVGDFLRFAFGGLFLLIDIIVTFIALSVTELIGSVVLQQPKLARRIKYAIGSWYYSHFGITAERIAGVEHVFWGDQLPPMENMLVICNHIGLFDFAYLFTIAERKGMLGFSKFFAKDEIRSYGPWGWCMSLLEFIWVKRDWTEDDGRIKSTFAKQWANPNEPIAMFIFPEGRRLTNPRHAEAVAFAKERGLPVLKNTLYPRVKGFRATIKGVGPLLDAVYDVTLGYPNKSFPSVYSYISGSYSESIHMHIRRIPISELQNLSEEELTKWVYDCWKKKDELLEYFYQHGQFPGPRIHDPLPVSMIFQNMVNSVTKKRKIDKSVMDDYKKS
jgi:1-acyl-sn-glycerol-3-phosphate acyltransferase